MFRNKEFKNFMLFIIIFSLLFIKIGFFINKFTGILIIVISIFFNISFFIFTKSRYKKIAKISNQINLVLHNDDHIYIGELEEGELSILNTEITKMTLKIREQNKALKKEKEYLANSLAHIAHQLRTPLTSLNLILSLIDNINNDDERKSFLREMDELLIQMNWLITSLLKISSLDANIINFKNEVVNLKELINISIKPFLISMELNNIIIKLDIEKNININGDFNWLSEAIQNIIKNCIESINKDGIIEINAISNNLYTEITIIDNGKGFDKNNLNNIFKKFYSKNKSNSTGYGIGLPLSKMIITRQGGTISAKNDLEGGAIFTIRFPK